MIYRQLLFRYQNDIKLNLIKIRLINFDFAKLLKILRVFADGGSVVLYGGQDKWD